MPSAPHGACLAGNASAKPAPPSHTTRAPAPPAAPKCKIVLRQFVKLPAAALNLTALNLADVALFDGSGEQLPRASVALVLSIVCAELPGGAAACNDGDDATACRTAPGDAAPRLTASFPCAGGTILGSLGKVVLTNR